MTTPTPTARDREVASKVGHCYVEMYGKLYPMATIIAEYRTQIEAEKDADHDKAIGDFQNEVRTQIIDETGCPDELIDGAGSDSGWEDFTLCEISQGIGFLKERIATLEAALEKAEKGLVGIVEYWNGSPNSAVDAIETVIERANEALTAIRSTRQTP